VFSPIPLLGLAAGALLLWKRGVGTGSSGGALGSKGFNTGTGSGGLTKSLSAARLGLANEPTRAVLGSMQWFTEGTLDPMLTRAGWTLGSDVETSSGYRSVAVNTAVDGDKDSDHMTGRAVDLIYTKLTAFEAMARIRALYNIGYLADIDQVIAYDYKRDKNGKIKGGGHLHIASRQDNPRGHFFGYKYILSRDGKSWTKEMI
jgi:hypothetical protein